MLVPAAVTLDAVNADHLGARLSGRQETAIAPAIAVTSGVLSVESDPTIGEGVSNVASTGVRSNASTRA